MKYAYTILGLAGVSLAQFADGGAIGSVCSPSNSSGKPDFNAPCNAVTAIEAQCVYGPAYLNSILNVEDSGPMKRRNLLQGRQSDSDTSDTGGPAPASNSSQQICFCQSQFFDQLLGCAACYTKHGDVEPELAVVSDDSIASLSASYCAASNTPTAGFPDVLLAWADSALSALPVTTAPYSASRDPIGNMTQVSLYYTPRVTGTGAWLIPTQTNTAVNTEDGQIKPTVDANLNTASPLGVPSTTTSPNAAMRTEAVAVAGMMGLAGLVALL